MKNILKLAILFIYGGLIYVFVELLFRNYSHWSMFILGGILFVEIGCINELFPRCNSLIIQGIIGSIMITVSELIAGLILNVYFNLNIWDYSDMPLNIMGQISLLFSFIWIFAAMAAVIIDDRLRFYFFKETQPKYKLF